MTSSRNPLENLSRSSATTSWPVLDLRISINWLQSLPSGRGMTTGSTISPTAELRRCDFPEPVDPTTRQALLAAPIHARNDATASTIAVDAWMVCSEFSRVIF